MTSPSSTGEAGNLGGLTHTNVFAEQQSSATQNQKALLGIVTDSLEQSFVDAGRHTLWKYSADSGHPALPQQIQLRGSNVKSEEEKERFYEAYEAIKALYPKNIRQELEKELNKPIHLRNPSIQALQNALSLFAETTSSQSKGALDGLDTAYKNAFFMGTEMILQEVYKEADQTLQKESSNPKIDHDDNLFALSELKSYIDLLKTIKEPLLEGTHSKDDIDYYALILAKIKQSHSSVAGARKGSSLLILRDNLSLLEEMVKAFVKSGGSSTLKTGLYLTKDAESPLDRSIAQLFEPFGFEESEKLAETLKQSLTLFSFVLFALSSDQTGPLVDETPRGQTDQRAQTFSLFMHLFQGYGELELLGKEAVSLLNEPSFFGKESEVIALFLGFSLALAVENTKQEQIDLFYEIKELVKPYFEEAIDRFSEKDPDIALAFQEALFALDKEEGFEVQKRLLHVLEKKGIDKNVLEKAVDEIANTQKLYLHAITTGQDDRTNQDTSVFAA